MTGDLNSYWMIIFFAYHENKTALYDDELNEWSNESGFKDSKKYHEHKWHLDSCGIRNVV